MNKIVPFSRSDFPVFLAMPTRWADNDAYGHVNNVTYYSYFDTAVNQWLIAKGLLAINSPADTDPVGLVVSNQCQFFASLAFPQQLDIGLRVELIGNTSVRYGLGVFVQGGTQIAAYGQFTHVYVNRHTRRPMPLPPQWRIELNRLTSSAHSA